MLVVIVFEQWVDVSAGVSVGVRNGCRRNTYAGQEWVLVAVVRVILAVFWVVGWVWYFMVSGGTKYSGVLKVWVKRWLVGEVDELGC